MVETFADLVAEIEKAVRPLGFKIAVVARREKTSPIFERVKEDKADDGELRITIVRKGDVG